MIAYHMTRVLALSKFFSIKEATLNMELKCSHRMLLIN